MKHHAKNSLLKSLIASTAISASGLSFAADITNLASVGANATQNSLGVFIDSWLNDNGALNGAGGLGGELFALCQSYANAVTAATAPDDIADALTLLDFVSNEEVAAIGSGFTDTGHDQIVSVLGRLQSLRTGTPGIADANHLQFSSGGAAGVDFSRFSYYANISYGDGDKKPYTQRTRL